MIVTSNHLGQPWAKYTSLLKIHGSVILLAAPEEPLNIPAMALLFNETSFAGSLIGGRALIKDMLDFAAQHKVYPWIEKVEMKKVNEALQRVRDGKVRYRVVMEANFD